MNYVEGLSSVPLRQHWRPEQSKGWARDLLIVAAPAAYMLGKRIALQAKPVT
ncbi:hypothetical protein NM449_12675 [Vibrio metschnikovii]|uniref:hypothetical protein n=1 Tax=Vibrio metschnikovii TaxID=28172 RepID=UPI00315D7BFC